MTQGSAARYAMSGKLTRVIVDSAENLDPTVFDLRNTIALAQSEEPQAGAVVVVGGCGRR